MASFTLTCALMLISVQLHYTDAACTPVNLTATETQQSIGSPNFPQRYGSNETCSWTITASTANQVVHVMSVDVDLHDDGSCSDKIMFYDGQSTTATVLKTTCGEQKVMLQSTGVTMYILFTSDGMREDKGFYLKIWSAPQYATDCSQTTISVGTNPVFLPMPPMNGNMVVSTCNYTLTATSGFVNVDLPGWMESEALACGTGSMKVYDGDGNDRVMMIDSCGSERPFWSLDSSGQSLTIEISTTYKGAKPKQFMLKAISMRMTVPDCAAVANFPIGPMSSYIWYPNFMRASGVYCDKTLLAPGTTVRVTVISNTTGLDVPCNSPFPVEVLEGATGTTNISKTCMPKPMFLSTGPDLRLRTVSSERFLLRVASFASQCNGMFMKMAADNGTAKTAEHEDIQRNSMCMYRVMAPSDDEVVNVHIESTLMDMADCVTVYDGEDKASPMEKMCGAFKKMFSSTGRYLSYEIMTDNKMMKGKVIVKYFSVRKEGGCPKMMNILAKREKVILTSPNFPMQYPLASMCSWRFVSYRPDYVVVIEVLESNLPDNCDDFAFVNDGESHDTERIGEWCGKRKPTYRGTGQVLMLTFKADDMNMKMTGGDGNMDMMANKGFRFQYYADTLVPREIEQGTDVLTIAGVLSIIVVACGIIFITYRLCNERRAAKKKEDQEPITH
ncbi:cubilin-like [Haliotis rubra]|uniref:cubilin-like n=1 Tax=Haliotis rubra TaxID=36100 RepID=UPI001EE62328|nr:cubilin-like [Haliotis rubra]